MRSIIHITFALFIGVQAIGFLEADEKQAVPSAEDRKEALDTIKSIFAKDYESSKREDKMKLADDLLTQARNSSNDFTTRYALFVESIEIANEVGAAKTAFRALEEMSEVYDVNPLAIEKYILGKQIDSAIEPEEKIAVYQRSMDLVDRLEVEREFDTADDLLKSLANFTRKAKDKKAMLEVSQRRKTLEDFSKKFRKIAVHQETLKTKPEDPTANLEIGKFECFELGNWEAGLSYLTKGSDAKLATLAAETVADPDKAPEQFAIASDWWELGEAMGGEEGKRAMAFAAEWYSKAEPTLTGLDKVLAKKRIDAAPEVESVAGGSSRKVDLISLIDISKHARPGDKWALEGKVLKCTRGSFVPKIVFPYKPPEEYDVRFIFQQPSLRNGVGLVLPNPSKESSFHCWIGASSGSRWGVSTDDRSGSGEFRGLIAAGANYAVEVNVRKNRFTMKVNGRTITDIPTDYSNVSVDSWHTIGDDWPQLALWCDDPTAFTGIQVIEVTGKGEVVQDE